MFNGTFQNVLSVNEAAASHSLLFKLVSSTFLKDFEGRWQVRQSVRVGSRAVLFLVAILENRTTF